MRCQLIFYGCQIYTSLIIASEKCGWGSESQLKPTASFFARVIHTFGPSYNSYFLFQKIHTRVIQTGVIHTFGPSYNSYFLFQTILSRIIHTGVIHTFGTSFNSYFLLNIKFHATHNHNIHTTNFGRFIPAYYCQDSNHSYYIYSVLCQRHFYLWNIVYFMLLFSKDSYCSAWCRFSLNYGFEQNW